MLTLYSGSQLKPLLEEMIGRLRSEPLDMPLASEVMVVQNHGMARWLSTQMARKSGIAANLEFKFPAEIIWDIYRAMDEDIPEDLPSDRSPMRWAVFRQLEQLPKASPYVSVWHYMRDDGGNWSPLKAWKLAGKIANIFDKYLNYRQEMLLEWERGNTLGFGASEEWQADLWRKLTAVWDREFTGSKWKHQAQVHRAFMEQIGEEGLTTENLPHRITLFGLSALQPSYIEAFVNISRLIDVRWFRLDPAGESPEHPLVQSWGGEGREFLNILQKSIKNAGIPIDEIRIPGHEAGTDHPVSGLLPSVSIHSCHSPLREVEVLYDRLLDRFEKKPGLAPDDILIMTPDLATYAPFIEAVFGTAEEGLPEIPFHIVDEQSGIRREVFRAFSKLLYVLDSRFKVTEVLDLLSGRPVMDRFGISEDELDRATGWIEEAKIRWGLDEEHKRQLDLPETRTFTWQFGIDRMMLGFASRPDENLFRDLYPFGEIESGDDAALLGKLARFIGELRKARGQARQPRTSGEWSRLLLRWINGFIPAGNRYYRAFRGLAGLVEEMQETAALGSFQQAFDYAVLLDYMDGRLSEEAGRGGYFGHGITFSGPDQMRTIPHEVVGMLGMNSEAFPRSRVAPDFDLMAGRPREGDRVPRNDDRYLFLETIRSAGQLFYLSYVGQSDRDDSSRPPSVLVSELLDHLAGERGVKTETLVRKHPLHAFSTKYFDKEEPDLFSYSGMGYEVSKKITAGETDAPAFWDESLPPAEETFKQLSLGDLVRFFENPSRYLLQQRLGLFFGETEVISEEREPFELKGLDGYKLGVELLQRTLNKKEISAYKPIARARGWLPDGWPGERAFREKSGEVSEFSAAVGDLMESPLLEPVEVGLDLDEFRVTGILDSLYRDYQLFFRFGSLRPKDLIKLWIYHLALQTIPEPDHTFESRLETKGDQNRPVPYLIEKLDGAEPILHDLLEIYWKGVRTRIPFFPNASYKYAREIVTRGKTHQAALSKARRGWHDPWRPYASDREDPYINMLYKDEEPVELREFADLSLAFWRPVMEHLLKEGDRVA